MNDAKYKLILTLLLINRGDPLNNSYKLMRILEWKFNTQNTKSILDEIKEKQYAEYDIINGVHYYRLTLLGSKLIKQEYTTALEFLLKNYPKEVDIIDSLFNSFDVKKP